MTPCRRREPSLNQLQDAILSELQGGSRSIAQLHSTCLEEFRPRVALIRVWNAVRKLAFAGTVERLSDPAGWYQLAGSKGRPLRLVSVDETRIHIEGVNQTERIWFDNSIRVAETEHGVQDSPVHLPVTDETRVYYIDTGDLETLNRYRSTLRWLADEIRPHGPTQAGLYERLAVETKLESPSASREPQAHLRPKTPVRSLLHPTEDKRPQTPGA